MSVCQYVNMSVCQYVRMKLFSLVIKMKVVQNVKTISENIISVAVEPPEVEQGGTSASNSVENNKNGKKWRAFKIDLM